MEREKGGGGGRGMRGGYINRKKEGGGVPETEAWHHRLSGER